MTAADIVCSPQTPVAFYKFCYVPRFWYVFTSNGFYLWCFRLKLFLGKFTWDHNFVYFLAFPHSSFFFLSPFLPVSPGSYYWKNDLDINLLLRILSGELNLKQWLTVESVSLFINKVWGSYSDSYLSSQHLGGKDRQISMSLKPDSSTSEFQASQDYMRLCCKRKFY